MDDDFEDGEYKPAGFDVFVELMLSDLQLMPS